MEKETSVLILLALLAVVGVWLVIAAERKRLKDLMRTYDSIQPGDKYSRVYRSMYGPEETVTEVVVVVAKSKSFKGTPMVTYEYEDDNTPYDAHLEDFLDSFERVE